MKQELTEGLIIKNYKVLCEEYLDVKPTKGNGRKYHFKAPPIFQTHFIVT